MLRLSSLLAFCVIIAATFIAPPLALAQDSSALINQRLDQPYSLTAKDELLASAFKKITADTGVRIEATSAVWDLLPWGDQTTLNAKIENIPLRQALAG